jgi:hypothetical protein
MRSLSYNYRTGLRKSSLSRGFSLIGNTLALLGGIAVVFFVIDFVFFAGRGTTNLFILLWEVTA